MAQKIAHSARTCMLRSKKAEHARDDTCPDIYKYMCILYTYRLARLVDE